MEIVQSLVFMAFAIYGLIGVYEYTKRKNKHEDLCRAWLFCSLCTSFGSLIVFIISLLVHIL